MTEDLPLHETPSTDDDLLEMAWVIIANAGWDGQEPSPGWQEAAERWRDQYHIHLEVSK